MKVEYKNIVGQAIKGILPCHYCCFSHLINCIPYVMHRCNNHIFKEEETSDIFLL